MSTATASNPPSASSASKAADLLPDATIIKWLIKNKMNDIESVGRIMALYYSKPSEILEIARNDVGKGSDVGKKK